MDSSQLTQEQWKQLAAKFQHLRGELQRLINRMQELKFPEDDPLFAIVWKVHSAVTSLDLHAHRTYHTVKMESGA